MLGFGVECGRRLVEDEHERFVAHESAGQRQLLPLAEAHVHAARPCGPKLRLETRGQPLNHVVAVNKFLGVDNRVAMTNRKEHSPDAEANEILYLFFEWALKK